MTLLIELCAGSAAVSLRYLSSTGRPPMAYQGGKRGYADRILAAMGLRPGDGGGADVVLCEPGPWGEAWDLWRTAAGRADTIDRLRAWAEEDPRALWERLRAAPPPAETAERVSTWAVLQFWNFGRKPVLAGAASWKQHGLNACEAYRGDWARARAAKGLPYGDCERDRRLPDVIAGLQALPDLSRVTVLRCRAEEVEPIPGAAVYIDPPYAGTTCAYGHDLPRAEVLVLAKRWQAGGARIVAVSEGAPLSLRGWHAHELGASAGFGRTWSKQRSEVLTLSRPARQRLRRAA